MNRTNRENSDNKNIQKPFETNSTSIYIYIYMIYIHTANLKESQVRQRWVVVNCNEKLIKFIGS